MSTEERIAELEMLVAHLQGRIDALVARNAELEAQVAQAKRESRSSSKPASSDGLGRTGTANEEPAEEEWQEGGRATGASRRDAAPGGDS